MKEKVYVAIKVNNAGIPLRGFIKVFETIEGINEFIDSKANNEGGYWKVYEGERVV